MREETFLMAMTIVLTTAFWLIFMAIHNNVDADVDSYRQGYAECKAGMESRYDRKVEHGKPN